ncbi:MAG: GNAT family N-acetyltransferase [Actinomycetes bacterium]
MNAFDETTLTTERLVLTPLRQADADVMVDVLGDQHLFEFIGGRPATRTELRSRYGRLAGGSGEPDLIWLNWIVRRRADEEPVGTVQATVTRQGDGWSAQIAWVIGVPWQAQGFATEAARALVHWLLGQGADVVTASIRPGHHASAKVATRAGLTATAEEVEGERVWRTVAD